VEYLKPKLRKLFRTNLDLVIRIFVMSTYISLFIVFVSVCYIPMVYKEKDDIEPLTVILIIVLLIESIIMYINTLFTTIFMSFICTISIMYVLSYLFLVITSFIIELDEIELNKREIREHKINSIL
jgi:hypothetical protein